MLTLVLWCSQCEWLLGDRRPSPEELDKGIDPESPLFQAILDNPVVQLGLTNPKTLLGTCFAPARWGGTCPPHRCPWVILRPPRLVAAPAGFWWPGPESLRGPRAWVLPRCDSLLCDDSIPALRNQL